MDICTNCKRTLPDGLTSPLMTGEGNTGSICGVCALELSNKVLGINRKKFNGEMAEYFRQKALKYYKKTKQI